MCGSSVLRGGGRMHFGGGSRQPCFANDATVDSPPSDTVALPAPGPVWAGLGKGAFVLPRVSGACRAPCHSPGGGGRMSNIAGAILHRKRWFVFDVVGARRDLASRNGLAHMRAHLHVLVLWSRHKRLCCSSVRPWPLVRA